MFPRGFNKEQRYKRNILFFCADCLSLMKTLPLIRTQVDSPKAKIKEIKVGEVTELKSQMNDLKSEVEKLGESIKANYHVRFK